MPGEKAADFGVDEFLVLVLSVEQLWFQNKNNTLELFYDKYVIISKHDRDFFIDKLEPSLNQICGAGRGKTQKQTG